MPNPTETATVSTAHATVTTIFNGDTTTDPMVAMTTPFSMPRDCLDFDGAEMQVWHNDQGGQDTTHLTRNLDEITRPECWPSGEHEETYSPAVCPSGWTYYSIIAGDYTETITEITSYPGQSSAHTMTYNTNQLSAYCCPSGFSMSVLTWSLYSGADHICSRTVTSGETSIIVTNQTDGSPTVFQGSATLMIPTPMTIFWHATDASTLTPKPPEIDWGTFAPSWVPGQPVVTYDVIRYDDSPGTNRLATGVFAAVIAVPIIIFLAILACCICCFRIRRRREKREMAKEQEESQALAVERSSTQERTPNHSTDGGTDTALEQGQRNGAIATAAPAAAGSSVATRQPSAEIQRPTAEEPPREHTALHSLSGFSKPPYPGLPSQEFDGIEEPPPYAEAAPSYPIQGRPLAAVPTSPTQEHNERTRRDESTIVPAA